MKSWLSEREVADLLNVTPQAIRKNVDRYATRTSETRAANGKNFREYHIDSLPAASRKRWAERHGWSVTETAPAAAVPALPPGGLMVHQVAFESQLALALHAPPSDAMSAEERAEADRRYNIIEPLLQPAAHPALWQHCAGQKLRVMQFLAQQHKTAERTIYNWIERYEERGLPGLVRRERRDKGSSRALNTSAKEFIIGNALPDGKKNGKLSIREIFRAYQEERDWRARMTGRLLPPTTRNTYHRYCDESGYLLESALLPEASYETFRVWFNRIPEAVRTMAREGEEAYTNTQEILSFRDIEAIRPMQYVVMDHRRLDMWAMAARPPATGPSGAITRWQLIRPWVTAALDMRTRKWLAWSVVEQPSSDSIASVMKRVLLDYGIPEAWYWDNGRDFRCVYLEGRAAREGSPYKVRDLPAAMRGVVGKIGSKVLHAIVKRARSKIIEPNFGRLAQYEKTLPWWSGNKAGSAARMKDARPHWHEKLLVEHERWLAGTRRDQVFPTIEQLTWLYDEQFQTLNERAMEGALGMDKVTPEGRGWQSPNEAWDKLIAGVEVRRAPADQIQFAFGKRRATTIRNSEVRATFGGREYHYRLTGEPLALLALNGRAAELAYDQHDLGTVAVYCDERFVGLADNVELRRMGEEQFVADERDRRAARKAVREFIERVHAELPAPSPMERALRRAARRAARPPNLPSSMGATNVALAEPMRAAAAAAGARGGFRFAEASTEISRATTPASNDDGEFRFFEEGE